MEDMFQVGIITSPHGVKGEVKVFPTTDDNNRFRKLKECFIEYKGEKKGEFNIFFRGIDFHDKKGVRVPIFIDFTKFVLNGASIFDSRVTVSHDSPYRFIKENVEDGEIIDIHIEWEPFDENSFFRT